jgi:hypothetical protein
MTESKEYKEADAFKRYLIRQIRAGKKLLKGGIFNPHDLPLDVSTLVLVKYEYTLFQKRQGLE